MFHIDYQKDHVYQDKSAVEVSVARKTSKGIKEEIIPDRPLDFICGEECTCDHAMEWKLQYDAHDVNEQSIFYFFKPFSKFYCSFASCNIDIWFSFHLWGNNSRFLSPKISSFEDLP